LRTTAVNPASEADAFLAQRQKMVELQLRSRRIRDERVLDAMSRVPRHEFVDESYRSQAYEDHPLPIGSGQTISQPYIVAIMLEALAIQPSDIVLEIGTGSGYLTAVLAELAAQVYSIERHAALAQAAQQILARLGYRNATVIVGDGSHGLQATAPFDVIVVSAAAPQLPSSLIQQLRDGGRMIVPVGSACSQELQLVRKQQGKLEVVSLEGCRFVPLIGGEGFPHE
jgi:protein-L-isoaspartate(D-aspartate) O-methyltransferase